MTIFFLLCLRLAGFSAGGGISVSPGDSAGAADAFELFTRMLEQAAADADSQESSSGE
jgi:hypothetical protein